MLRRAVSRLAVSRLETLEQAVRMSVVAAFAETSIREVRWIDAAKVRWEPRMLVPMNRTLNTEMMAQVLREAPGVFAWPLFVRHQVLVVAVEAGVEEDAWDLARFVGDHR